MRASIFCLQLFLIVSACATVACYSKEWDVIRTADGKVLKNAKLLSTDAVGIKVSHEAGISKILFNELPKEISSEFKYDPAAVSKAQIDKNLHEAESKARMKEIDLSKEAEKMRKEEIASRGASMANEMAAKKQADAYNRQQINNIYLQAQQAEANTPPQVKAVENLKTWVGRQKNELIQAVGVPSNDFPDGNGGSVMTYEIPLFGGRTTITNIGGFYNVNTTKQFLITAEVYSNAAGTIYNVIPRPTAR